MRMSTSTYLILILIPFTYTYTFTCRTTSSSWIGTNEGISGPAIEVSVKGTQVLDSTLGEKLGSLPLIGKFLDVRDSLVR